MTTVWSYGGGVQSAAIGVLVRTGRLPRPDFAVIADTGREAASTWTYLRDVMQPYLDPIDLRIEIAPHSLATIDLVTATGDLLMPLYTEGGKMPTFCSAHWKRRVVARWLTQRSAPRPVDCWLGISLDEIHRMKTGADPAWMRNRYPLVDLRLSRADCFTLLDQAALPRPEKSACWMCPHRTNAEWRALAPDDFAQAVRLERDLRERDPGVWLHAARAPLDTVDLTAPDDPQIDLFCESGFCMT